ncbi:unnamed protein product [Paramecium sonneborni]|uniref:RING-type domain-containing protein n=1 Tax=Paramecium sonneborni TaxID=65129 RepID=A0A8S1LGJ7_9CILI|nr:unnamed protein product [Paramecium sonneborni]
MNPIDYIDDDDDFAGILLHDPQESRRKTQRSHTIHNNSNRNTDVLQYFDQNFKSKYPQEQLLFAQKMKQCQQMFQRKMDKHKGSNNGQLQEKQNAQTKSKKKILEIPQFNFNNLQKQIQIQQPPATQKQSNTQNTFQSRNPQIKIFEIQENFQQKKSHTMEICSVCLQPKEIDHQCNDEYGIISCPYCSDHIVRNFLKDHLEDCIQYIENQFQNLEKIEECSICMENLVKDQQTLKCSHQFHKSCIDVWKLKSKECPVCRKPI